MIKLLSGELTEPGGTMASMCTVVGKTNAAMTRIVPTNETAIDSLVIRTDVIKRGGCP